MLLVSIRILPDEFHIQSKLPLSTVSQRSGSTSPWSRLQLQHMAAAGNATRVINNNDPDLTKHAWGLKGVTHTADHLYAVMEWQHAGLAYIPPPPSVPLAPSPTPQ